MDGILYKDLMESYQQVHQDSLDEDVIPEELEAFASALIEEGYDLSDVTWDEVREAYLEEQGGRSGAKRRQDRIRAERIASTQADKAKSEAEFIAGGGKAGVSQRTSPASGSRARFNTRNRRRAEDEVRAQGRKNLDAAKNKPIPDDKRPAASSSFSARRNARRSASPAAQANTNSVGQNIKTTKPNTNTTAKTTTQTKPAQTTTQKAAKPVQTATQKKDTSTNAEYDRLRKSDPAAAKKFGMAASKKKFGNQLKPKTPNPLMSKPATSTAPKPSASPIKSSRLSAALDSVKKPAAPNKPSGGGLSAVKPQSFKSSVASGSAMKSAAKPAPTVKPAAGAKFNPNAPKIKLNNSVELSDFDIILEHLIEQGFGNDEALKIMVNMSEEKREEILVAEGYKGKHGQSDEEQMDSRSDAAKQISGDSKYSGAAYSHRSYRGVGKPAKPGERQKDQGKMTDADRDELAIRKNALKKKTRKEEDESLYQAYLSMMSEEDYDKRKDSDLERGGMNARKDDREPLATGTGVGKKKVSGDAFGQVVSKLKKQYGDKAIMDKKSRKES